jgi:hypothetical protein
MLSGWRRLPMIKRLPFRIIPIEQLRKMKQRKHDMESRKEAFYKFLEREKKKGRKGD